jgi:patatin-like phospholipase/acyl hydrolase
MSAELQRFQREIVEVCEFYVDDDNEAKTNILYKKNLDGTITFNNPSKYIRQTLGAQGIIIEDNIFTDQDQNTDEEVQSTDAGMPTVNTVQEPVQEEVMMPDQNVQIEQQVQAQAPVYNEQINQVPPMQNVNMGPVMNQQQPVNNGFNFDENIPQG